MHKRSLLLIFLICLPVVVYNQTRNLSYYLDKGLQNSPLLKDYNNQINSALVDSLLIRSSKLPQVEARSQLLYSPVYGKFGYDEVVTDGGLYTGVVGVSQNILNKRDINNRFQSVNIQRQSVVNSAKISIAELRRMISAQYLAAFADLNELAFNKASLELARREIEIVTRFVSQGLYRQTDLLSLQIETQTQEILVNQLSSQYEKDLRQLNQLCGIDDPEIIEISFPELTLNGTADINKSPLFLQYRIDSLRIENEKKAVDVKYLLKMNWFADAGFLSSTPWNFYTHFGYSAGVGLSIPIYDGHQRVHEKQKLSIAENTRSAYKNTFRTQYDQQIRQLSDELKALQSITSQLERQLSSSQQLVSALRGQLETGIILMTEYITAIKNLRGINKNLSDNRIRIQLVINELNYLVTQ
jgi:outer membrane protein TolC